MLLTTLLPTAALLGLASTLAVPEIAERSTTCTTNTPNIPNEVLSMPAPTAGEDWVIRFGSGHHTTDTAGACLSTLNTDDYYWEVSNKNVSYNACTTIHTLMGDRYPARAAIWLSGNSNINAVRMFFESSLVPKCSQGANTFCNVPGKAGWHCLSNMYLVDNFVVL